MYKTLLFVIGLTLVVQHSIGQQKSQKVIIDCDPGIDDAIALIVALESSQLEIIGITTVFGNVETSLATENAMRILDITGRNIPVFEGAKRPLYAKPLVPPDYVHGNDGLGNVDYPGSAKKPENEPAAGFIVNAVKKNPGEISVLTLGPMTNLALAAKLDPHLPQYVKQVIVMGGAVSVPGNVTPVAEANIMGDPHAADIVFTSPMNVTMIGLDVTTKVIINEIHLSQIKTGSRAYGDFIYDISQFYMDFYRSTGVNGMYAHDPTAVAYLLKPELFATVNAPVRVVTQGIATGETIMAYNEFTARQDPWKEQPKVKVATGVDSDQILKVFNDILSGTK